MQHRLTWRESLQRIGVVVGFNEPQIGGLIIERRAGEDAGEIVVPLHRKKKETRCPKCPYGY